jgi:FixJ family two-component response regulator
MNFPPTRSHLPDIESSETPIVFIVDGDAGMRDSLESLVRAAGWQAIAAASAEEFLARPPATIPCCLLLEQHLPGSSGFDLQDHFAGHREMPIVFMSARADVPGTVRAMKAGALEFLTKPFRNDVLLSAIESAIECSRSALRDLGHVDALLKCYELLSRRERDVMRGVVSGRLNKQVGGDLGISEITVKAHRGRVMRKMGAHSLPELVRMAARLRASIPAAFTETPMKECQSGATVGRSSMEPKIVYRSRPEDEATGARYISSWAR